CFSVPHEIVYILGCFVIGTTEVQFELDERSFCGGMCMYVFDIVYTVPTFFDLDPSQILAGLSILRDALTNKQLCSAFTAFAAEEEKIHQKPTKNPQDSVLYPAEEVEVGVENSLNCFVNHFYPPSIKVSLTKTDPVAPTAPSCQLLPPAAKKMLSLFGSTYLCEKTFSVMNINKSRVRTRLSDSHLRDVLRVKTTVFEPDLD
uniref:Ig-like domain-containing protein n=1 Tax=Seriola lalandi dorsalis TaxID=1841481 RepID=A0A3B4XNQ5_SERLL